MSSQQEHPILFSGPMVRAILDGRKTQTRRVVKHEGNAQLPPRMFAGEEAEWCPYGGPGDRFWVRETWATIKGVYSPGIKYRADDAERFFEYDELNAMPANWRERRWRPSIHMPRWISRLTLAVTNVRVERVQEISEAGALAEGIMLTAPGQLTAAHVGDYQYGFRKLWDSINAKRGFGWSTNPWVWIVEFERVKP